MAFRFHTISLDVVQHPRQARMRIREAIREEGSLRGAAKKLGISYRTLIRYRLRLGMVEARS